jgi:hypothetical protein
MGIRDVGHADNARARRQQSRIFLEADFAGVRYRHGFDDCAFLLCYELPWHDIGMVF